MIRLSSMLLRSLSYNNGKQGTDVISTVQTELGGAVNESDTGCTLDVSKFINSRNRSKAVRGLFTSNGDYSGQGFGYGDHKFGYEYSARKRMYKFWIQRPGGERRVMSDEYTSLEEAIEAFVYVCDTLCPPEINRVLMANALKKASAHCLFGH